MTTNSSNNFPTIIGPANVPSIINTQDIEDDAFSRDKVINAIEQGAHAVAHLTEIAIQSQDPEHYDALSKLLKVVIEGNESLLRLRKMREDLAKPEQQQSGQTINNLFVGSTSDLLDALDKAKEQRKQ